MDFNHEQITELFANVRKGKSSSTFDFKYIISEEKGEIAQIFYLGNNEWRIFIDNFPMQKKFYQTNFPITTVDRFISEMAHIGLNLKLKTSEGELLGGHGKDCQCFMCNDLRD